MQAKRLWPSIQSARHSKSLKKDPRKTLCKFLSMQYRMEVQEKIHAEWAVAEQLRDKLLMCHLLGE